MPTPDRRQVNLRLNSADAETLSALAYINGVSATEVVRPVVEEFLQGQQDNPKVRAAQEIRASHRRSAAK